MKKLLLTFLLSFATSVNAESWYMRNTGGGEITLTKEACYADNQQYTSLSKAYTWTNAIYLEGCWTVIDGNVHIIWISKDGSRDRRVYNINNFVRK